MVSTKKKENPLRLRQYYQLMHERAIVRFNKLDDTLIDKRNKAYRLKEVIKSKLDFYKKQFNIDLLSYNEFVNNMYINGKFHKAASIAYLNKKNDCTIVSELYDLICLANVQKKIVQLEKQYNIYKKLSIITYKDYEYIVNTYYEKVQELMILDGKGYSFAGKLGWTCINRIKKPKKIKDIDFAATKAAKEKLIEEGKRPYDAEEAKWCKENNIPYDGVEYRVFRDVEYIYELPLIECHITNGSQYKKITSADYISKPLRGKTYDDLIEMCHRNIDEIIDLNIDIKKKLELCLRVNPLLYTKYIRNEDQKSYKPTKISRKN